jgi:hypothetical protein
MEVPSYAWRATCALLVALIFAAAHVTALYLYFASGGQVPFGAFGQLARWLAMPAGILLLALLIAAASRSLQYARAVWILTAAGALVSIIALPLAFLGTPRAARDDLFEPNLIFLLMPVPQAALIVIALVALLLAHRLGRRHRAVA